MLTNITWFKEHLKVVFPGYSKSVFEESYQVKNIDLFREKWDVNAVT